MSQLILYSNSTSNPQTLDLTGYMNVNDTTMNPDDPNMTSKIWGHSLQRQGATLALEQLVEREPVFPLLLGPVGGLAGAPTNMSQTLALIQRINQIGRIPGATLTWQPLGASQVTTFDVLSIQVDVNYDFWKENQHWTSVTMRVFTEPLGRTAGPRPFASASAVGPLLMISPYASGTGLTIGASTQAGVAGYGGQQQGASSGVFYWGSPSLAGDGPAQLQISYAGPVGASAPFNAVTPYAAVGLLPDQNYQVLFTTADAAAGGELFYAGGAPSVISNALAVASTYLATRPGASTTLAFQPNLAQGGSVIPPTSWAGTHRILAIARASGGACTLSGIANSMISTPVTATVYPGDWAMLDVGTFSLRASQVPGDYVMLGVGGSFGYVDVTAVAMLPDNAAWFLNPTTISPIRTISTGGGGVIGAGRYAFTNTLILDDVLGDQFLYVAGTSAVGPITPSPIGTAEGALRLTQYTRGLVPQPDPKNGLPIIAIVAAGQPFVASSALHASASWQNPQNRLTTAQVSVLEKYRYISG